MWWMFRQVKPPEEVAGGWEKRPCACHGWSGRMLPGDVRAGNMPVQSEEDETSGRTSLDELLSLGTAPVLPAGGGAARPRLHYGDHHEHHRGAAGDPAGPGHRRSAGL